MVALDAAIIRSRRQATRGLPVAVHHRQTGGGGGYTVILAESASDKNQLVVANATM